MNIDEQLTWSSPLSALTKGRKSKNLENLEKAGIEKLNNLLWLLPNKIEIVPGIQSFESIQTGFIFKGVGKIIRVQSQMNYYAKGRGKVPLYNLTVNVKDLKSENYLVLKWFNCYPNIQKKLKSVEHILFYGKVTSYGGIQQITNPSYDEYNLPLTDLASSDQISPDERGQTIITYPTINKVSSKFIKSLIDKIPHKLWIDIEESVPPYILAERQMISLREAFQAIHAKEYHVPWTPQQYELAKKRLIYEEFLVDQIKINLRRKFVQDEPGCIIKIKENAFKQLSRIFPYTLTEDQQETIHDIANDLSSGKKMMRLIQGDVGCGKTSVALAAAFICLNDHNQVALMAPTESLAIQHFYNIKNLLKKTDINIQLILGGTKASEKRKITDGLASGEIQFIIGTHSLIQKNIRFKKLCLAIIDEQHKFGVNQRIKLTAKGKGVHSIIMSATPIPRSLSLTQYGDLDISIIKNYPANRKGTRTKIVKPHDYEKFLTFINTRLSLGEQVYLVVPAIEENENTDIVNLERIYAQYKEFFPGKIIEPIHGQMDSQQKSEVFKRWSEKKIEILIATSVIEVGIDVANATVMAIFGPERFGLSSLHQLRGRVGRAQKPGFCFLILEKKVSAESLERLEVIEKTNDGFEIAEKDLELRGQGNLFGANQSGQDSYKAIANIITHQKYLEMAREDLEIIDRQDSSFIGHYKYHFENDYYLSQTT